MYSKVLLDGDDSQRSSSSRIFKAGVAIGVFGGACLGFLSVMAISNYSTTLPSTSAAESTTNLFGLTSSSLQKPFPLSPTVQKLATQLPGPSPWKELTLSAMEQFNGCDRDVSANANRANAMVASLNSKDRAIVKAAEAATVLKAGVQAPTGFWDPLKLSANLNEGQLLFYREAELKHGRICMVASLGFLVQEKFHPIFGDVDVPSALVGTTRLTDVALQFWPAALLAMLLPEIVPKQYYGTQYEGATDRIPGDLGYDPLGLKPKKAEDLLVMQNKELANGRLAMLGWAGMVAQELVSGQKVLG